MCEIFLGGYIRNWLPLGRETGRLERDEEDLSLIPFVSFELLLCMCIRFSLLYYKV